MPGLPARAQAGRVLPVTVAVVTVQDGYAAILGA